MRLNAGFKTSFSAAGNRSVSETGVIFSHGKQRFVKPANVHEQRHLGETSEVVRKASTLQ